MAGEGASMLVPMDVDEDGRLDILVQDCSNDPCTIGLLYNNEIFDSFFIKAMMLA